MARTKKMDMMLQGNRFKAMRSYADEKKACLMLNLRPDLLEEGPPQAIADTVREVIQEGGARGTGA